MRRQNWLIAGIAATALVAGLVVATWLGQPGPAQPGAAEKLLLSALPDLHGQPHPLTKHQGKILVVNFWATWCSPCRDEVPFFIEAQAEYGPKGLQFVGIALDDNQQVASFVQEFGVNYPILIGSVQETETLRELGNAGGGLPYTLIYDRSGNLREKIIGGLDKARLERLILPLI